MNTGCPVEVKPYSVSNVIKSQNAISLNYTNQDFYSMKTRLVDFIKERFGPQGTEIPNTFNDFVESSVAIMLIENWAFLADTLSFKMDQIVNELFIGTVTEVENAFRLSKLVGFNPQPPIASRSLWTATINNPLLSDLFIPTPVSIEVVASDTPINIEVFAADADNNPIFDSDIVIPAGQSVNQTLIGIEGRTVEQNFSGTGEVAQTLQLNFAPVIYDSIRIEVDGVLWEQVEFFTDSQPRREYRIEMDSNWNGYVIFGNNRAGLIPSRGSKIKATFRVGGGVVGNIVAGAIESQKQAFLPGLGFNVPVTFKNYTKGEYGYDGDTIEDIRKKLPAWIRTQNRAVSGDDYKTLADQFSTTYHGQIGKAVAVLRNHGCAGNIIDLYILAKEDSNGLANASNELKIDLHNELRKKKMLTDYVCIRDGLVIETDIAIDITLNKFYRKFELELRENITNKVNNFFLLSNWEYGQSLRSIDVVKYLSDIKEIQTFDITFTTNVESNSGDTVTAKFYEIIRPSDITISFIYN